MLEECIVNKIHKGIAFVGLSPSKDCGGCKACVFGKNKKKVDVPAIMEIECNEGDKVLVEIPQKEILAAPIYLYLIPLIMMLIGFIIGSFINIIIEIVLGFVLLFVAFVIIYLIDRFYFASKKYSPKIIKIIQKKGENND